MKTQDDVLEQLYDLCSSDRDQAACELALEYLEQELSAGRFHVVDAFLAEAGAERLSPAVLLCCLSITVHGKDRLTHRVHFLERTEKKMVQELGKERAFKLLEMRR